MRPMDAVRALVVASMALAATAASAFEFHGYFRDSAAFNSKGGTQVCFQLPGTDFKARLGNECDRYLEFGFSETGKVSNVEWKAEFMPASYQPSDSSAAGNSLFVQQMWLGLKFNDWDGATLWAGRRYFGRHDVHSIDWFYWNPAQGNAAVGLEGVNLGFGKLAASLIRIDATQATGAANLTRGTYLVPDVRLSGIPLNPNGTLELGVDIGIAHDQQKALGLDRAGTSALFTIQHNQDKLLGGSNSLAVQYGSAAFAKESGDGPGQLIAGGTSDDKQWRIIEHLVVNPTPAISGALVLVYQDKSSVGTASNGSTTFSAELRPAFHVNDWFKFAVDGFYQQLKVKNAPAGLGTATLMKVTAAPTFVLGRGYWSRPELRLFVTYASWNDDAVTLAGTSPIASGAFGTAKNGTTFGASVETWF